MIQVDLAPSPPSPYRTHQWKRFSGPIRWLSSKALCKRRRSGFDPWFKEGPLEKEMATHSSILAWEIPWTEEPGRLQSMGSQRVGQDLATKPQQQGGLWIEKKQEERTRSHTQSHPLSYKDCQAPLSIAFASKNSGVGCHPLLQGIFPTQGWNPCLLLLLHSQAGSFLLVSAGKPHSRYSISIC